MRLQSFVRVTTVHHACHDSALQFALPMHCAVYYKTLYTVYQQHCTLCISNTVHCLSATLHAVSVTLYTESLILCAVLHCTTMSSQCYDRNTTPAERVWGNFYDYHVRIFQPAKSASNCSKLDGIPRLFFRDNSSIDQCRCYSAICVL